MDTKFDNESLIHQSRKAKFKPNFIVQIFIFYGLLYLAKKVKSFVKFLIFQLNIPDYILPSKDVGFIATGVITIICILYCTKIEKRDIKSMGLVNNFSLHNPTRNSITRYIIGFLTGAIMFSAALFICYLGGTVNFVGCTVKGNVIPILIFLIGFLIQGMQEEVLMRGYFMLSLANSLRPVYAILINAFCFSMLHSSNNGVSFLALFNLFLFGIFTSLYVLKTNNLWGACAFHSAWNFFQGNFYGIIVSGSDLGYSVFKFTQGHSNTWLNGGSFGLEGGLAVTIVLVISIVIVYLFVGNRLKLLKAK